MKRFGRVGVRNLTTLYESKLKRRVEMEIEVEGESVPGGGG